MDNLLELEKKLVRARRLSAVDEYIAMSYLTRSDGLFDGSYEGWRVARANKLLKIFSRDWFVGKRILELGAGHADLGAFFAELGAEVCCAEGRRENAEFARLKHRDVEGLRIEVLNLDNDFTHLGRFDLVINFGLLYHIVDIDTHLGRCFSMSDDVVLESVVCDSLDPYKNVVVDERSTVGEEALSGKGSRPSPAYVERLAGEHGFEVIRFLDADLNVRGYEYDWLHSDNGNLGEWSQRRFWRFLKKG
jgi:SAM-dependent methyltransferase